MELRTTGASELSATTNPASSIASRPQPGAGGKASTAQLISEAKPSAIRDRERTR